MFGAVAAVVLPKLPATAAEIVPEAVVDAGAAVPTIEYRLVSISALDLDGKPMLRFFKELVGGPGSVISEKSARCMAQSFCGNADEWEWDSETRALRHEITQKNGSLVVDYSSCTS